MTLVPRTRLIGGIALVVLPCTIVAGVVPGAVVPAGLLIAIFVIVAVIDAALAHRTLVNVHVELPQILRLQKDRPGAIEVKIRSEPKNPSVLRLGFAFPPELGTVEHDRLVRIPSGAVASRLEWPCIPRVRGQYFLERAYLEGSSPFGFWAVRKSHPLRAEVRVYPNLVAERKNVAALFLKRAGMGVHVQRQAGQGREFEKLREYLHGDSIDDIHWKASAKRGHPVTKVFQIERTQEVYVIVDSSRLTARSVALEQNGRINGDLHFSTTALERFVAGALILALAAEQQGDQFGLIAFSDKVLHFVRAKSGQAHFDLCRDRLYTLQPHGVTPDFDELCSFIRLKLRKRALLIVLTALDDPILAEGFTKAIELVRRQHFVVVDMLKPDGADPIFSGGAISRLDDLYGQLGGHLQWHQLRELKKVLQRRGVRLAMLDPVKLPAQLVAQHAEIRARQLV